MRELSRRKPCCDPLIDGYYEYPARSELQIDCDPPGSTPNTANCSGAGLGSHSFVGQYTASASPFGTFDQGGNVDEWTETRLTGGNRINRGGSWTHGASVLAAADRRQTGPNVGSFNRGFRVAALQLGGPPPHVPAVPAALGWALAIVLAAIGPALARRS